MPIPAYIVCAMSGVTDESTRLISLFNVVESFDMATEEQVSSAAVQLENPRRPTTPIGFRVVAAWCREPNDANDEAFENQIVLLAPDGQTLAETPILRFTFGDKFFYRVTVHKMAMDGLPMLGTYLVQARLRRENQTDWFLRQSFPFQAKQTPPRQLTPPQAAE